MWHPGGGGGGGVKSFIRALAASLMVLIREAVSSGGDDSDLGRGPNGLAFVQILVAHRSARLVLLA